jgi:tRNA A-37 threonylcarbamoyl transferase component Bud32
MVDESNAAPAVIGSRLAHRYTLREVLGEGAAGIVYAATDDHLGREVAIKIVRRTHAGDPSMIERAKREARACARIGHANIVSVSDVGTTDDGLPFAVMERLEGESLAARIARKGRLAVDEACDIHLQLLDALVAAHAAGVLHRDVKPANVFVVPLASGVLVKLLDFGLASLVADEGSPKLTTTGIVVGSLAYLAPERLLGAEADARGELYSAGASLYESLSGDAAFHGINPLVVRGRILAGSARSIAELRSDVSPALAAVVERALARSPDERFASCAEMRDALAAARRGSSVADAIEVREVPDPVVDRPAPEQRPAPRSPSVPRARLVPAAVLVALLCVLSGALVWSAFGEDDGEQGAAALPPRTSPAASAIVVSAPEPERELVAVEGAPELQPEHASVERAPEPPRELAAVEPTRALPEPASRREPVPRRTPPPLEASAPAPSVTAGDERPAAPVEETTRMLERLEQPLTPDWAR